jgi:hypothetical protein
VSLRLEAGVANWFIGLKAELVQRVGCEERLGQIYVYDSVSVWLLAEK